MNKSRYCCKITLVEHLVGMVDLFYNSFINTIHYSKGKDNIFQI